MRPLVVLVFLSAFALATTVGDWYGYTDEDDFTDEETTYMMVRGVGGWAAGFDGDPYLLVMFLENDDTPYICIDFNGPIGYGSPTTCLTRLDDNEAQSIRVSGNDEILMFDTGSALANKQFFASLLDGNEFVIRYDAAAQPQVTLTFSLSGITGLANELGVDTEYYLTYLENE